MRVFFIILLGVDFIARRIGRFFIYTWIAATEIESGYKRHCGDLYMRFGYDFVLC